jgi:hypothetical protein
LFEGRDIDARSHADPAQSRARFDGWVKKDFGAGDPVPRTGDLDENGIVDQAIKEIALHNYCRAQFAAGHVGELPIDFDHVAAIHTDFRMRSSSAELSQFRPKGFSINRTLS